MIFLRMKLKPVVLLISFNEEGSHHQADGSLLVDINRDVGALDPGVCAQVT